MNTLPPDSANRPPPYQAQTIGELIFAEPVFSQVVEVHGPPPAWRREPGFATMVRIILEQQVSLASAKAAFERLTETVECVTPERFLTLTAAELKSIGFSHQKMSYSRNLADALLTGVIDFHDLVNLDDDQVRAVLTSIKGIGIWTANIYLLMAMERPDIWPRGDIALAEAYRRLKGLANRPTNSEMEQVSNKWRPWRSTAARILWHYYLSQKDR